jgi:hypothetical protein
MSARERALKGKLVTIGDKGVPRVLATGDPVMTRFKGDNAQAYYPGFATELLDNWQWHIIYDNRGEEDLFVRQTGKILPDIMHLDGTYVKMQKVARATLLCKKSSKGVVKVVHAGFGFMLLDPQIVKLGSKSDALAKRMLFKYDQQHVKDGKSNSH